MTINSLTFKTLTIGDQSFHIADDRKQQYHAFNTYLNTMIASAQTVFANKVKKSKKWFNDSSAVYYNEISDAFAQDVMARLNIDITNYRNQATFYRLAFMYLLTYIPPFSKEVRNTKNGWVTPENWAIVKIHETKLQNSIIECEKVAKISFNN